MQFPTFFDSASDTSATDFAMSASVLGDVYDVLAAMKPASPELSPLARRAIESMDVALREAAGVPADIRWRIAYGALADFVDLCAREGFGIRDSDSFERLSTFLAENADLLATSADEAQPLHQVFEHARGC